MTTNTAPLDTDELMQLALRASSQTQTELAIGYLKRIIELQPSNARALYLLGALHAEIGLYDRAIEEIGRAVQLNIGLPTAHFQLGLLHATAGRVAEAKTAWAPLEKLGENDPLLAFKSGLEHLVNDEFPECVTALKRGLQLNTSNPALSNDMTRILTQVEPLTQTSQNIETSADDSKSSGRHVLLSAYQRNDFDTEH